MCFFNKKKTLITGNRFQLGQLVSFKYRDEINPGIIYHIKLDKDNKIIYDVQIGGECPAVISNIKEEDIFIRR